MTISTADHAEITRRPRPHHATSCQNLCMTANGSTYFETWKGIGRAIGRSERWCRYMTHRADPLPVFKVGGMVRLDAKDLEAWLSRERFRTIARDRDLHTLNKTEADCVV